MNQSDLTLTLLKMYLLEVFPLIRVKQKQITGTYMHFRKCEKLKLKSNLSLLTPSAWEVGGRGEYISLQLKFYIFQRGNL